VKGVFPALDRVAAQRPLGARIAGLIEQAGLRIGVSSPDATSPVVTSGPATPAQPATAAGTAARQRTTPRKGVRIDIVFLLGSSEDA